MRAGRRSRDGEAAVRCARHDTPAESGEPLASQQHLPLQRGAVERTRGENRHVGHRDQSPFEGVRKLSTVALKICPSGTCVTVALLIASASSPLPRC